MAPGFVLFQTCSGGGVRRCNIYCIGFAGTPWATTTVSLWIYFASARRYASASTASRGGGCSLPGGPSAPTPPSAQARPLSVVASAGTAATRTRLR